MREHAQTALPTGGKLDVNIIYFVRTLRRAGIVVGPAQTLDAIRAVQAVGFSHRSDFFYTLRACLVTKAAHLQTFEQVFALFWRDPQFIEQMMAAMLPMMQVDKPPQKPKSAQKRANEAMLDGLPTQHEPQSEREELQVDAQISFSGSEKLKAMDFEQMSNAELAEAKREIGRLALPVKPILRRRLCASQTGTRIDASATLRRAMRTGGEVIDLQRKSQSTRMPDLVTICDISGSMSVYSRMFMHFLHTIAAVKGASWARVHSFTFGTKLTNITRSLDLRDPDAALNAVGKQADDWDGGTRIGDCLEIFNKAWSRRVLAQGGVVLLVTDGLERANIEKLAREAKRLSLSSRQLIWLNPLLRWDGFSPQAAGIKALLPYVDSFHACHNLNSFSDLTEALSKQHKGDKSRMMALL